MVINRETAMRLWNKAFGKAVKAKDFAGREMAKPAYDDRDSNFGWNIDHIVPQSEGGKTTESNLICCHILTNDEKSNKFPCFTANNKRFKIIKVENHFEIREATDNKNKENANSESDFVDFFDSAAGTRLFNSLKSKQNKELFVGTVNVTLYNLKHSAVFDFISKVFADKNIFVTPRSNNESVTIVIKDNSMPLKSDIEGLLDDCVLLNTYLEYFFIPKKCISDYKIFYGVHTEENQIACLSAILKFSHGNHKFTINELVLENTKAKERLNDSDCIGRDSLNYRTFPYNYIYTKLSENLKK